MLAFVTDLIFSTKIASTAAALGAQIKVVRSLEKLDERLASGENSLVIIDLNADGVDVLTVIAQCKAANPASHVVAFASHVQVDLINAARKAGADEIMARSAFVNKLPAILASESKSQGM